MSSEYKIEAQCICGSFRWIAPAPEYAHTCNCGQCEVDHAAWSSCDPSDIQFLSRDAGVVGKQADRQSPRHYCCENCGSSLWTWTADAHHIRTSIGKTDFENPNFNWNVRLMSRDFTQPQIFSSTDKIKLERA